MLNGESTGNNAKIIQGKKKYEGYLHASESLINKVTETFKRKLSNSMSRYQHFSTVRFQIQYGKLHVKIDNRLKPDRDDCKFSWVSLTKQVAHELERGDTS